MNDIEKDRRPDGESERTIPPAQLDHVVDLVMVRMRERRKTRTRWLINLGVTAVSIGATVIVGLAGSSVNNRFLQVIDGLSDVVQGLSDVVREIEGTRRSEELRTNREWIPTESDDVVLVPGQPLTQNVPEGDVARLQLRMENPGRYRLDVTVPNLDGNQPDPDDGDEPDPDPDPVAALYRAKGDQSFERIGFDDDGGDSLDSMLVFNAPDVKDTSYFLDIWEFYGYAATFNVQLVQLTDTQ